MITAFTIISICLFITICLCYKLYNSNLYINKKLLDSNNELKTILERNKKLFEIKEGDNILFDYSLTHTDPNSNKKTTFSVLYEAEVLKSTIDRVKVKGIDYTSSDDFARKSNNKPAIVNYITNKWIDKNDVELIINSTKINRENKIDKLLSKKP